MEVDSAMGVQFMIGASESFVRMVCSNLLQALGAAQAVVEELAAPKTLSGVVRIDAPTEQVSGHAPPPCAAPRINQQS